MEPTQWQDKPSPERSMAHMLLSEAAWVSSQIAKHKYQSSLEQFAEKLANGRTWSALYSKDAEGKYRRRTSQWAGQQCFGVDIDKLSEDLADLRGDELEEAILRKSLQRLNCLPNIIHQSFSHAYDKPKYRLIYCTQSLTIDASLALQISKYLCQAFGGDPAVCDIARLFYGTNKACKIISQEALSSEILLKARSIADIKPLKRQQALKSTLSLQASILRRQMLINTEAKFAEIAYESGYETIFKCTQYLLDSKWLTEDEILRFIEACVTRYADKWRDCKHLPADVVEKAIQWRKQRGIS